MLGGLRTNDDLHAQGSGEAHDGGEAGVAVGGKGFIEAGPAHADLLSESAHVLGSGNVLQGSSYDVAVAGVLFRAGFNIESGVFYVLETFGRVPICVSVR